MLDALIRQQSGVLTRAQALACGVTKSAIEAHLRAGRWRRVWFGVYATFTGPLPRRSLLWAAVLRAGADAVLSHETAAELAGLVEAPSAQIHVTVAAQRSRLTIPGVVVHRSRRAGAGRHPSRTPPQTRIEDTVIDLTQSARTVEDAMGWLARAVGARVTTAGRLATAIARRPRLRWRDLLRAALADVAAGCHSLFELRYLRDVERAHGLPPGQRQVRVARGGGYTYDDVYYRRYGTRVELDGRAAHPDHDRWRDYRRDNATVVGGERALRYGLSDVADHPCHVAAQVGATLQLGGWTGRPARCGRPDCVIP